MSGAYIVFVIDMICPVMEVSFFNEPKRASVCLSLPSPEDGNRSSLKKKFVFFSIYNSE
jgi:hypothetical protein